MVPEIEPETEFRLRLAALELEEAAIHTPQVVAAVAVQLAQANAQMESVLRKATARICELEAREAIEGRSDRPAWINEAARQIHQQHAARPWWAISWPRLW